MTKVLGAVYPVGSIYIGTQSTCPMATLISGSTWEQIQGRYLLASGTLAGTSENYSATDTVAAGLPDHAHNVRYRRNDQSAYHANGNVSPHIYTGDNLKGSYPSLNASESNSVYGQSTTNRPAAYVVNVWRRTA